MVDRTNRFSFSVRETSRFGAEKNRYNAEIQRFSAEKRHYGSKKDRFGTETGSCSAETEHLNSRCVETEDTIKQEDDCMNNKTPECTKLFEKETEMSDTEGNECIDMKTF